MVGSHVVIESTGSPVALSQESPGISGVDDAAATEDANRTDIASTVDPSGSGRVQSVDTFLDRLREVETCASTDVGDWAGKMLGTTAEAKVSRIEDVANVLPVLRVETDAACRAVVRVGSDASAGEVQDASGEPIARRSTTARTLATVLPPSLRPVRTRTESRSPSSPRKLTQHRLSHRKTA